MALDASGNLYIADYANCRVREVSGGTITTVAGNGDLRLRGRRRPRHERRFVRAHTAWRWTASGNLYIADSGNCRVREVSGGTITTVAGTRYLQLRRRRRPRHQRRAERPWGVAVDASGNLYIADISNCRVREVSGGTITTVAGTGTCGYGGDGGPATSAALYYPTGVAVDASGNLYIADYGTAACGR